MNWCIVYLASPRSFGRHEILKASLRIAKKCFPSTDIYVFHEDYTDQDFGDLPSIKEAIRVDFSGHDDVYNPATGRRKGYLLMCRFFCGILQSTPQLQSYSHYMRLDDDSFFLEPYPAETHIQRMLQQDYTFRTLFLEEQSQQSLYEFTIAFLKRNGVGHLTLIQIKSALTSARFLYEGRYTGLAPYNNFHMSSLRMWKHPLVVRYLQEIESIGGILRYGWLDANVHAMIVYVLSQVASLRVLQELWFGYRHNTHVSPLGRKGAWMDLTLQPYPDTSGFNTVDYHTTNTQ